MKAVVFLDLDETLVAQERAFDAAFAAVARVASCEPVQVAQFVQTEFEKLPCAEIVRRCRFGGRDFLWADPGDQTEAERRIASDLVRFHNSVGGVLDMPDASSVFRDAMEKHESVYPDALPAVQRLAERTRVAVITNGMQAAQQRKLDRLGLTPYVERLFASTLVGVGKPDRRIFAYALSQMAVSQMAVQPEQAAMVGDSLHGDVAGAQAAGIEAVWIRRDPATPSDPAVRPDAELADLRRLEAFL